MELDSSTFQLHGPRLNNCRLAFKYGVVKCSRFVKNRCSLAPTIFTNISVIYWKLCDRRCPERSRCFYVCVVVAVDSSRKMMAVSFQVSKISWTNFLVTHLRTEEFCVDQLRVNDRIWKLTNIERILCNSWLETRWFVFDNRSHVFPFKRVLA